MPVLKYCVFAVGIVLFVVGCKDKSDTSKSESMAKVLKITWQRLIDEKGQTCQRCGSTEKELQKAFQSLKKPLAQLGIRVTLEKKTLDPATCAKDISQSNRILIAERALEDWLAAKVGKSPCGFCCAELGEDVECRTVQFKGQTYETIPAELIIKAGLLAGSKLLTVEANEPYCENETSAKIPSTSCCPKPDSNSKECK